MLNNVFQMWAKDDGPVLNEHSITAGLRDWYHYDEDSYDKRAKFTLPLPQWIVKAMPTTLEMPVQETTRLPEIVVRSRRGTIVDTVRIQPRFSVAK